MIPTFSLSIWLLLRRWISFWLLHWRLFWLSFLFDKCLPITANLANIGGNQYFWYSCSNPDCYENEISDHLSNRFAYSKSIKRTKKVRVLFSSVQFWFIKPGSRREQSLVFADLFEKSFISFIYRDNGIIMTVSVWQVIVETSLNIVFFTAMHFIDQGVPFVMVLGMFSSSYFILPSFYFLADNRFRMALKQEGIFRSVWSALKQKYEWKKQANL